MTFFKESGPEVLWQAFDYGRNAGEHSKSNQNEFVIKYMDTMTDRNSDLASEQALHQYVKFFPAGTSYQNIMHFKQLVETGEFKRFDYGPEIN